MALLRFKFSVTELSLKFRLQMPHEYDSAGKLEPFPNHFQSFSPDASRLKEFCHSSLFAENSLSPELC
ncbi:hypothetical protein A6X21_06155 [Planctopirus hydrillae]|uniref:Uncharacterized protein n=1 Tax=Planctopirus hydrillae TaxID=1841610 RepID=A0A1C3EAG6_9PLAN|nr:hypothetical protein A6X21_06155 [Planctopirus hydrillae]